MSGYVFRPWSLPQDRAQSCNCIWVPRGHWAAEFTECVKNGVKVTAQVVQFTINDREHEVQKYLLEEGNHFGPYKRFVFSSKHPFGLVGYNISSLFSDFRSGPNFLPARQIHKGELGQWVTTYTMPEVIETTRPQHEYWQEHGHWPDHRLTMRWVNLADVCRITEMSAGDLLACYLPFAEQAFVRYPGPWFLVTDDKNKVDGKEVGRPTVRRTISTGREEMLREPVEHVWISVHFASNILRLHWLGYQPGMIDQAVCAA